MQGQVDGTAESSGVIGAEALFRAHAPYVVRLLARLGMHGDEIDDLVQEVFLTAHRRGGYAPGAAKATTWLAEIAVRVASTARRTRRRRRVEPDDAAVARAVMPGGGPYDATVAAEALARVDRALDALDLDHRSVFVLFELDGEPCDVIAEALGVPVGTVYSRLHAARRSFRRAYDAVVSQKDVRQSGGAA